MTTADASSGVRSQWPLIKRLLLLTWRYRAGCIRVVALHGVLQLLTLGGLGLFGLGVDYVRGQLAADAPPVPWPFGLAPPEHWPAMTVLGGLASCVAAIAVVRALLLYGTRVATANLVNRQIIVGLRSRVYDKMQRLSFRFFDANASGTLINRVTSDVQRIRMFVEMVVVQSLVVLLTLAVSAAYMLHVHAPLALACLLTSPLMWMIVVWFSRTVKPAFMERRRLMDEAVHRFTENLQGVHVVRGFGLEEQQKEHFADAIRSVREQGQWIFWRQSIFIPVLHFLNHVNAMVLLGFGGYLAIRGDLAIGTGLTVFAGLLQQIREQVQKIGSIANSMQESIVGAERVFDILDAAPEIETPRHARPLPRPAGAVAFEQVAFAYHGEDWVLRDITFRAEPGECVAILGATGAGKTALLSLIPRFYDPQRGRVLVDGVDVRRLVLEDLRRAIGLVFQESFLFSNTVAANIAFGHPEATPEQIENAARIASAHDFVMEQQSGYETVIGERGIGLSGGQRQRLAIARAVLLDPAILLLDDPTAAIDPETEDDILQAMDDAMEGRTTFVVAHRLSTLQRADKVIVLDRGRIVETGTHHELVRNGGRYREAVLLQLGDRESRRLLGVEEDVAV